MVICSKLLDITPGAAIVGDATASPLRLLILNDSGPLGFVDPSLACTGFYLPPFFS